MTDISNEAVERLAKSLAFVANETCMSIERCEKITESAATTLRALIAERDTVRTNALREAANIARDKHESASSWLTIADSYGGPESSQRSEVVSARQAACEIAKAILALSAKVI